MKIKSAVCAIFALVLFPLSSYAQIEDLKPGIYAVVGDDFRPLSFSAGWEISFGVGSGCVTVTASTYRYKGATSGVQAGDSFILVIDPKRSIAIETPKRADVFIKTLSPENMDILPLDVNLKKNRRELPFWKAFKREMAFSKWMGFDYDKIGDNVYKIKVHDLAPGEYGIYFRLSELSVFNPRSLFCFTISEPGN